MLKIYKASAGSGKTYTLAYEYIKALLGVKNRETGRYCLNSAKYLNGKPESTNRHKYILAITFTNKATEEMKHRIIDKLDALSVLPVAGNKDADYADRLCDEFGCTRAELAEVAGKALRQLLNFYSVFNVTTIDSFFQRVLRTFARELDRQGDFSIELNDMLAVQAAVNAMLDDFNREGKIDSPLGRWIVGYLATQFESGEKTNFFNRRANLHTTLVNLLSKISEETFKEHEEDMEKYLAIDDGNGGSQLKVDALLKALAARRADIIVEVKDIVAADLQALADRGVTLDQVKGSLCVAKYIKEYFLTGKLCTKEMINYTNFVPYTEGTKDPFKKTFKGTDADKEAFADMLRIARSKYFDYFGIQSIERAVGTFTLLAYAWRYLKEFSTSNNTVLLSDTGSILNRIIGEEDTPFIYERMGVNLRNFLIDEFQDTSRLQWSNLMPLVGNGLSEGHDSLIIGDEKQSIYRFRNSDSSLLHTKVEKDLPAPEYGTTVYGTGTKENTNWRSASDIVLFNNTLFTNLAYALHVDGFENVCQAVASKNLHHRGYVEFVPVKDDDVKEAYGDDSDLKDEAMRTYYTVDLMASRMMRQHDELGYSWKDMAVLVNTNKEGALVVERLMTAYPAITVMSEESLYVRRSPAVQLIIGVLQLMNVPDTGEVSADGFPTSSQLARIMSRLEYYRGQGFPVDEAIDLAKAPDASGGMQVGIDAIRQSRPSSLPALVETIIREQLSEDDRRSQVAYLTAFLD
ncbi:MAG: UvrD-helicase domain-containing protein, partial [Muribaculaceae bacterium]|nr:UvrD-helicase domain-containing protein [Muribaculaceae bacterium]